MAVRPAQTSFEATVLPYLDAAYNLARWLAGSKSDAEDIVQEALVRALTYFPGFRGTNARGWFLQIVRNAAYAALNAGHKIVAGSVDIEVHEITCADTADDPETALIRSRDRAHVSQCIARLDLELREVLVMRELEDLSYKEIAVVTGVPIGTVMSRLWRARRALTIDLKAEAHTP